MAARPPPFTPYHAWQRGISLWQAFLAWGGGDRWQAQRDEILDRIAGFQRVNGLGLRDRPLAIANSQDLAHAWEACEEDLQRGQAHVLALLKSGRLAAIGFHEGRDGSLTLLAVPRALWSAADVDWQESGLAGPNGRVRDVRVLDPLVLHAPAAATPALFGRSSQ